MNKSLWIASAVAAAVALPLMAAGCARSDAGEEEAAKAEAKSQTLEKCYGVVRAGKNDCQTATSSCAGTARADRQADAWIHVPAGLCQKIAGGSLKGPSA
jgi:uncharacterized membrane protein